MESSEPQIGSAMVDDGSKQDVLSNSLTENGAVEKESSETKTTKKMKNKKKKSQRSFVPKIGCLRFSDDYPTGYGSDEGFTVEVDPASTKDHRVPTHLVVTVNGIVGSAGNWRFAAKKLLEKYPQDVIVHCSECNSSMLTLDGIDVMGERLAEEVKLVIKSRPELQKISFVSHSLGGLVARYAIAKLYGKSQLGESSEENRECRSEESGKTGITRPDEKSKGKLAGLEPQNFITFATPHLGSRGHKQIFEIVQAFCRPLFSVVFLLLKRQHATYRGCLVEQEDNLFLLTMTVESLLCLFRWLMTLEIFNSCLRYSPLDGV
ncbi:hypothetical protein Scep_001293 [Stephania cephalantha]|uniref:DUF676 domain-containing protein n=1 Tax=Stephania cephalantha TaxID=152367 RepID=A0AAP0Q377_9MAGN